MTQQALSKRVSHLKIQSQAPPSLDKELEKEEEAINPNIRSSSFWSS